MDEETDRTAANSNSNLNGGIISSVSEEKDRNGSSDEERRGTCAAEDYIQHQSPRKNLNESIEVEEEAEAPTSDANLLVTESALNTNEVNCKIGNRTDDNGHEAELSLLEDSRPRGGGGAGESADEKATTFQLTDILNSSDDSSKMVDVVKVKMAKVELIKSSKLDGTSGGPCSVRGSRVVSRSQETVLEDDVKTNMDLVEENLYLGNLAAACDIPLLKKYRISHILTIDSCPLPTKITDLSFINTKYLKVSDMPREDILRYFEETNEFISKAVVNQVGGRGGNILVHCYYGVSRSATIVLAYLMHKHGISLEEAQERLKSRRSVVGPNYGFLSQLKLYEKMGFRIDRSNIFYKRFRLHVASDKLKSVKVLATPYTDVIKPDPALFTVKPEPVVYRCRKCRRILACASNVLHHTEKKSPVWFDFHKSTEYSDCSEDCGGSSEGDHGGTNDTTTEVAVPATSRTSSKSFGNSVLPPICNQMLFIEPLAWMSDSVTLNTQGKIHCPNTNCNSKLGSFSWVMGCLCPCGAKVQPAFYLVPSKVDRSTSVLNVQITI